jgi:hypothetical protein
MISVQHVLNLGICLLDTEINKLEAKLNRLNADPRFNFTMEFNHIYQKRRISRTFLDLLTHYRII